MRPAGHTYCFRDVGLERALEHLAALGFAEVEVWLGHIGDDPEEARRALLDAGLRAVAVGAGGFYRAEDDTPARAGDAARSLGAGVVVCCAAPGLVGLLRERVGENVRVAVENHWDQPLDRTPRVLAALEVADDLGACLDTGHALMAGEDPAAAIGRLRGRLDHVHLKDAERRGLVARVVGRRARKRLLERPHPVFPGSGSLDVAAVRRALVEAGYEGAVSFEHEGPGPDQALRALLAAWTDAAQAT